MKSCLILLVILSSFLIFFHLGERPLLSSGEARAGEIAKEMLERGNLIVPYLNEKVLLTKPPLFHWLIIACYKCFGINEFSTRIPSGIAGVLTVIVVYLLGKRFWGEKAGFISGIILTLSPLFFWSARCARIDSLLLFFITASLYCFLRGFMEMPYNRKWFLGWFFFIGLGMLAKGPVGVIIPLVTALLFLTFTGRVKLILKLNWLKGMLLFFLIVLPWFLIVYFSVPHYKSQIFFGQQNVVWLSGGGEWYKGYLYFFHLFAGFLPWSLALPFTFVFTWKKLKSGKDEKILFLWIWFFTVFLIFFFTGKKVSRYLLPLYPAISLLTANVVVSKVKINPAPSCAVLNPEGRISFSPHPHSKLQGFRRRCGINRLFSVFFIPSFMLFTSYFLFILYFIPIERDLYSPKGFCNLLRETVPEGVQLLAYKSWDNTIRFYYDRHVTIINTEKRLVKFLNSNDKIYCFMWADKYKSLPETIKARMFIINEGYKVLEHKVVLVSNKE